MAVPIGLPIPLLTGLDVEQLRRSRPVCYRYAATPFGNIDSDAHIFVEVNYYRTSACHMHAERDIVMANPSVRLSVTFRYCSKTNAFVAKLFATYGNGVILVFFERYRHYKFPRGTPSAGALNTRSVGKICDFLQKSSFISETGPWLLWNAHRKS